jgi:hypothetical protein
VTRRKSPSLTADLAELERTDPAVAAASRKYDETVAKLNVQLKRERDAMIAVCEAAEAWRDFDSIGESHRLVAAVDALRAARKGRP